MSSSKFSPSKIINLSQPSPNASKAADSSFATGNTDESSSINKTRTPVCLVLGMAGSGKTTLVDALSSYIENMDEVSEPLASLNLEETNTTPSGQSPLSVLSGEEVFVLNLDPAVYEIPYEPNIDIRDAVDYKAVMKDYNLGPNGAIITSLNLYATRFDQVLSIVERRAPESRAMIVDTPGQIETFTWSASGAIITDAFAMTLPTLIIFVIDADRSRNSMTFVSNMLYACSIMYKTRLPMIIVFNKVDISNCEYAQAWMRDFDEFDKALNDSNFIGDLARSMAMTLEEFYKSMPTVGVSAVTGDGIPQLVSAIQNAAQEYESEYRPLLEERKRKRAEEDQKRKEAELQRFKRDAADDPGRDPTLQPQYVDRLRVDDDAADDAADDEDEDDTSPRLTPKQKERLSKMMRTDEGEEDEEDDEEERQAFEEFRKYIEAVKGKKI